MSEELENSVRNILVYGSAVKDLKKNDFVEFAELLEKARSEGCEREIKDICDEQLNKTKENVTALYFSGMIGLHNRSLDNSNLVKLFEVLENNLKKDLAEYICDTILEESSDNKFALRKRAEYYKADKKNEVWDTYEKIVKLDIEEATLAETLAKHYEEDGNEKKAISYYQKALLRYINNKNINAVKPVWSRLVNLIPEDLDFFLRAQRAISKNISEDKSALLMQELYQHYKDFSKWDTAISILKLILEIDSKDSWARKEIVECYRGKYQNNSHIEEYIKASNLTSSFRDVFEAISDFEKHIAFAAKNFVFHRSWGVGFITKVQGDQLYINFGKNGTKEMSLKMAVNALQPLPRTHIWVIKATTKDREALKAKVKENPEWALETIIKSFNNSCDDKKIKAELVPSILSAGEWTSWHAKAQKELSSNLKFGVDPENVNLYIVRDHDIRQEERLSNEFKAEKQFFARVDILMRYANDEKLEKSDELFTDMLGYFTSYLKAFNSVDEQVVASYLVVNKIAPNKNPATFTFEQLYGEIENPREMYESLKDTKNTSLRDDFISCVRGLSDWDDQFINLFPTVLDKNMLLALISDGKSEKVTHLVQDSFNDYRNYRDAAVYFFKECRNEEWFKTSGISYEKQLVTLVNIISLCYREINNHVNTTENKKTIKNATTLLFADKGESGTRNTMLEYMLANDRDTITRMYTMVNDVKDLDPNFKTIIRNGILSKYSDFQFKEAETKQEAPKGLLVTATMLEIKKAEAERIEKEEIPANAIEVSEARAKGDLKENAEYTAAKEKQHYLNHTLTRLKEELSRAVIFDPTTASSSLVSFGTTVTLKNNLTGSDDVFTIMGPWESNAEKGIISYLSPLGNNLLDSKVGETRKFTINEHPYDYTVKEIKVAKDLK